MSVILIYGCEVLTEITVTRKRLTDEDNLNGMKRRRRRKKNKKMFLVE